MNTTTAPTTFAVGDRVRIEHPREAGHTFVVTKKLPRNYRVTIEGGTRTVVVSPELLAAVGGEAPVGQPYIETAIFHAGELVTLRGKVGVHVVLKHTPRGYSVAMLGGDAGRYWNAPAALLTPLAPERLAAITEAAR